MSEELSEREEAAAVPGSQAELAAGEAGGQTSDFDLSSPEGRYLARSKSFVSRARQLSDSLQHTWDAHARDYVVPVPTGAGHTAVAEDAKPLSFKRLFDRKAVVRLEVGTGNGDQIVSAAVSHPDRDYIGFEVYRPGVAQTVSKAVKAGVDNLRIIEADAAQALPILFPEGSLDEVWTFFPDPWRKTKHHKRRLVQAPFAETVARVLRPGGIWRLATDWSDYAFQMRDVIEDSPYFENPYAGVNPHEEDPDPGRGGFAPRWEGRVMTKFERRAIDAGREVFDLVAQRLS